MLNTVTLAWKKVWSHVLYSKKCKSKNLLSHVLCIIRQGIKLHKRQLYSVKPVTLRGALVLRGTMPGEEEDRRDGRDEVGDISNLYSQ